MRSSIYFIAGLVFLATLPGHLRAQKLYVLENSGQQTSYVINDIRKLYFSSGTLIIEMMEANPGSYPLDGLRYLNFTDLVGVIEKPAGTFPEVNLFPNPVNATLQVEYPHAAADGVSFEICSMDGRQVYSKTWPGGAGSAGWSVDMSSLAPGAYLCRFRDDQRCISKIIIKK